MVWYRQQGSCCKDPVIFMAVLHEGSGPGTCKVTAFHLLLLINCTRRPPAWSFAIREQTRGAVRQEDPLGGLAVWQSQRQCPGWCQCLGTVPAGSQEGLPSSRWALSARGSAQLQRRGHCLLSLSLHTHPRNKWGASSSDSSEGKFHLQEGCEAKEGGKTAKREKHGVCVFENCTCFLLRDKCQG